MRHVVLAAGSPLAAEASDLASRGALTRLDPGPGIEHLGPHDFVVLEVAAAPRWLDAMTERCRAGRLGAVRLVSAEGIAAWEPIGFRVRPWVQSIHLVGTAGTLPPGVAPAPVRRDLDLAAVLADFDRPAFRPEELPTAFPPKLQIETTAYCTIDCPYCPIATRHIRDRTKMGEDLFVRLLDECRVHRPDSLELYLNGDPLTDPRLEHLADLAKAATPTTLVEIITHERSINDVRAQRLAASGLDVVFVSVNFHEPTDEATMRARLGRIAGFRRHFLERGKQLVVVTLMNLLDATARSAFERIQAELGLPYERFRATGRLGDVDLGRFPQAAGRRAPATRVCERPFTKAYVRATGAVLLCCEDWQDKWVLGNVHERPLAEIWTSELYRRHRRNLLSGTPSAPCDGCEYAGTGRQPAPGRVSLPLAGTGGG